MKKSSQALLASAILAVGSAATAVATEPPLKILPLQQDIWITGTIERGNGQYALGDYTILRLDRPSAPPCDEKVVSDILIGKAGLPDLCLCCLTSGSGSPSGGASSVRIPASALCRRRMSCFRSTDDRRGTPDR